MAKPEQISKNLKTVKAAKDYADKIAELKKKHNIDTVFVLEVEDLVAFLKKPSRADVAMARALGEGDYIKIQELLLDAIWLEGDEAIRKDDDYFLNALKVLDTLIESKRVELKKN